MSARPHEHRLKVRSFHDLARSLVVERCVVYGANHLSRCLVAQGEEMWKVVLAESCIVAEQSFLAPFFLGRCFVGKCRSVRNGLNALAMLFPLFECQFLFCCCCHGGVVFLVYELTSSRVDELMAINLLTCLLVSSSPRYRL